MAGLPVSSRAFQPVWFGFTSQLVAGICRTEFESTKAQKTEHVETLGGIGMLTSRVIPCLDVRDNRVVKGVKFNGLRDVGTPALLAAEYERQGADELVVLDVSATNANRNTQLKTVQQVREALSIPLTVGGGVRTIEDVQRLTDAGTDKVSMNSAAVQNPDLIGAVANLFGSQCTVVAVDVRWADGHWEVLTHAGTRATGHNAIEWVREVESLSLIHI